MEKIDIIWVLAGVGISYLIGKAVDLVDFLRKK
jgi:hypothetical protein